jgi:RNA polymerase sigma-70 factor (ECF subfamily)
MDSVQAFEAQRPHLLALAYRMLGDLGRAEDIVQDAWFRWQQHADTVDTPRAFLVKVVTRLCLNELSSARARREEARGDRLPVPVDLNETAIGRIESIDRISMAFLVLLQRLTPAERAALLLYEVYDLEHREISTVLNRTEAACRQLVARARAHVAVEPAHVVESYEEHQRLLHAFAGALADGDHQRLIAILARDATAVVDTGPSGGRLGRIRNVGRPVVGARKIAAFFVAVSRVGLPGSITECELNGGPALVRRVDGVAVSAIMLATSGGLIDRLFIQTDAAHLRRIGRDRPFEFSPSHVTS